MKRIDNEVNNGPLQFPITPAKALKHFMNHMTDYEKGEILDYKQVHFLGVGA